MPNKVHTVLHYVLLPLSWLYGMVTGVRNWLFDHNVLPQEEYDVPVITVGNLTVGGTGKTPHVEYILGMLAMEYNMAVLSRGYKRKTKGFIIANSNSTPDSIGDEPLQMYQKFGMRAKIAVCESRRKGIMELLRLFPDLQLIVLDDGFQHRYVKPKVSVLLMDYNRPVYDDHLLPLGRLRENARQTNRADMVVVTKCPDDLSPLQYRLVSKKLDLMPYQKLYFSNYSYGALLPVFPDDKPYHVQLSSLTERDSVMLLTGVANPRGFVRHFRNYPFKVKVCHYPDHHSFTRDDIRKIEAEFKALTGERKIILTTEKDAVRLAFNPYFPSALKPLTYFLPIAVRMIPGLDNLNFIEDLKKAING
jgi:tetraacyldisaccharide 4'-kinase